MKPPWLHLSLSQVWFDIICSARSSHLATGKMCVYIYIYIYMLLQSTKTKEMEPHMIGSLIWLLTKWDADLLRTTVRVASVHPIHPVAWLNGPSLEKSVARARCSGFLMSHHVTPMIKETVVMWWYSHRRHDGMRLTMVVSQWHPCCTLINQDLVAQGDWRKIKELAQEAGKPWKTTERTDELYQLMWDCC